MTIKTAKKLMKMSALLGFVALGSLSLNAAAAVITFGTGTAGFGGVVSFSSLIVATTLTSTLVR